MQAQVMPCDDKKKEMKEGDYLRQRVSFEDDADDDKASSGCLTFRRKCTSVSEASPVRGSSSDEPSGSGHRHQNKLAAKLYSLVKARSEHAISTSATSPKTSASRKQQQQQNSQRRTRRYVRVVKNENAPPPEQACDNPNIICRYDQEFLQRHYEDAKRKRHLTGGDAIVPALPYSTSGHTILKKCSTDPTSDRQVLTCVSAPAVVLKHATFSDVVTVLESEDGTTHEEQLRDSSSEASDVIDNEVGSPFGGGGFFLNEDADVNPSSATELMTDGLVFGTPEEQLDDLIDGPADHGKDSSAMMSVFDAASTPDGLANVVREERRSSLQATKHVKLTERMAQLRSDNDGNSRTQTS